MSTSVFPVCDGVVSMVTINCAQPNGGAIFKISSPGLSLPVTGFSLDLSSNYQFQHSLNEFIYVYAFGERVGELILSGMGFLGACGNAAGKNACGALKLYKDKSLGTSKKGTTITLGNCGTFWAFLTGLRIEVPKPDVLVAYWSMRFHVILKPGSAFGNEFRGGGIDRLP